MQVVFRVYKNVKGEIKTYSKATVGNIIASSNKARFW